MLRIADDRPQALRVCMEEVVKHLESGHLSPITGKVFPASELAAAHHYVESRQSVGKVVCQW
jgi:NADPH2:quinone reductase